MYTACKHYVRRMTNMLQYEYRATNIRVCGLYPADPDGIPRLAGQRIKAVGPQEHDDAGAGG